MLGRKVNSVKLGWLAGLIVWSSVSSNCSLIISGSIWSFYWSTLVMKGWVLLCCIKLKVNRTLRVQGSEREGKNWQLNSTDPPPSHLGTLFPNCWSPNSHSLLLHSTYCSDPGKNRLQTPMPWSLILTQKSQGDKTKETLKKKKHAFHVLIKITMLINIITAAIY